MRTPELEPAHQDGAAIFTPEESLDGGSVAPLGRALLRLAQAGERRFLIDCTALLWIHPSAVRRLRELDQRVRNLQGRLVLCSLSGELQAAFRAAELDAIFPIFAHRDAALQYLGEEADPLALLARQVERLLGVQVSPSAQPPAGGSNGVRDLARAVHGLLST